MNCKSKEGRLQSLRELFSFAWNPFSEVVTSLIVDYLMQLEYDSVRFEYKKFYSWNIYDEFDLHIYPIRNNQSFSGAKIDIEDARDWLRDQEVMRVLEDCHDDSDIEIQERLQLLERLLKLADYAIVIDERHPIHYGRSRMIINNHIIDLNVEEDMS